MRKKRNVHSFNKNFFENKYFCQIKVKHKGIINEEEYANQRKKILNEL